MPTQLPRINVTMTREQHKLLAELAAHTGYSSAGFLRLMLDAATPLLRFAVPELRDEPEGLMPLLQEQFDQLFAELVKDLRDEGYFQQLTFEDPEVGRWLRPNEERHAASVSERGRDERGRFIAIPGTSEEASAE